MAIRLTGINSGLDTDTIVQALVSAYSYKKDTYVKAQTKLSWTQDAWKTLNTKVYSLYTNISNLRFSTAYNLRKTTCSDPTKATITASNSAVNGSQKLNILQTAQSGYLTGGKLDSGVTTSTTLAELGYTSGEASINVDRGDGTSTTFTVKSTSTVGDVINELKNAGLNASLDTTNNRIFVSAKDSGADADFNLIGADTNGASVLSALGLSTSLYSNGSLTAAGEAYQKYAAYATGADGSAIQDTDTVKDNITEALRIYEENAEIYKDSNAQISNLTSAITYATSYSNVQDFYAKYGISEADQTRFNSVMSNYSASSTALVDDAGNVYTKTSGTDVDGNEVYAYADSDGNRHYVAKVTTYTLDGETYHKNTDGKYVNVDTGAEYTGSTTDLVKDENKKVSYCALEEQVSYESNEKDDDGNAITYNIQSRTLYDDDGNETGTEYYFVKDGNEYVSSSETGKFTYTDDDGNTETITISKKYSYVEDVNGNANDVQALTDAYAEYQDAIGFTDEEFTPFQTDLKKVIAFEAQVTDTENLTGNTKLSIMGEVHDAYAAGGAGAINDLLGTFASEIASLKTGSNDAAAVMEANSAVSNLAGISDPDARAAAIDEMVTTAISAAQILSDDTQATGTATKLDGQDAIIKLNGVEFTSSSNSIEVNGLTINALAVTGDGDENALTITTATDTQGIYDKIKDFLTEYNTLINEMCKLYNADSSSGYEPLTDDEKEAMSDSEIEKWEAKIKESLLRRDTTLNSVMNSMINAMAGSIEINGKKYSLSSFGIKTLGYFNSAENENYAYHIDGDEDDVNTSGNTDRLMAMITSDPDTVMTFFQQLTSNLYTAIGNKMQSTSLSSVYTIYNDKQLATQYSDYTKLIAEWEEKVTAKEEYYYNKFSSMETALASLNSTQSALAGYFG